MSEHKKYTSIKLNASVYNTYKTRPNTIPHALGEFIDNAIGSYQQNKERLIENEPNYKLHIDINIEWVEKKTTKITIRDTAAGISEHAYLTAFEPAHKPDDDKGLNEFITGLAQNNDIKFQYKKSSFGGNDARAYQISSLPCKTAVISLACRYIHSPVSCSLRSDVELMFSLSELICQNIHRF